MEAPILVTDRPTDEITTRKCPQWFNRSGWFSQINYFFFFGLQYFLFRLSMDGKAFICITVIELMMHRSLFSTSIEDLECIKDNKVKYCNNVTLFSIYTCYVITIENKFVVFLINFSFNVSWQILYRDCIAPAVQILPYMISTDIKRSSLFNSSRKRFDIKILTNS